MTTRKIGVVLIIAGGLLLTAALCLFVYNVWDSHRAGDESAGALAQLNKAVSTAEDDGVPLYMLAPDMEMPTIEIDGHKYIGRINIPSLGLSLPVMDEWSYPNLKIAPCRYSGTAYKDDFVIAAHNYSSHFGRIKTLEPGAAITFTDVDGNVFDYQVAQVEQLQPTAIEEMTSGGWALSLFTCTTGGEYRVTVRCEKADSGSGSQTSGQVAGESRELL